MKIIGSRYVENLVRDDEVLMLLVREHEFGNLLGTV